MKFKDLKIGKAFRVKRWSKCVPHTKIRAELIHDPSGRGRKPKTVNSMYTRSGCRFKIFVADSEEVIPLD